MPARRDGGHEDSSPRRRRRGDRLARRLRQREPSTPDAAGTTQAKMPQGDARLRALHARERRRHARPEVRGRPRDDARRRPGARLDPDKMRAAEKACAKYRDAVKPPEMSDEEQAEFKKAALANAQLHARARHRLPGPDVRRERRRADASIGRGHRTRSRPKFQAAQKACREHAAAAPARRRPARTRDEAPRSPAAPPRRRVVAAACSAPAATTPSRAPRRRARTGDRDGRADATWSTARASSGTLGYADAGHARGGRRRAR